MAQQVLPYLLALPGIAVPVAISTLLHRCVVVLHLYRHRRRPLLQRWTEHLTCSPPATACAIE